MKAVNVHVELYAGIYRIWEGKKVIKKVKQDYVADLIKEHKFYYKDNDRITPLPIEIFKLAEYHYKKIALRELKLKGQIEMASRLRDAYVTQRRTYKEDNEDVYVIRFSSNFEVKVSPLHYRLFKGLNNQVSILKKLTQTSLQL